MMAVSAWLLWIIPFFTSLLMSISCKDGGVYIQGVVVVLQIAEKPLIKGSENIMINGRCVLIKKSLK